MKTMKVYKRNRYLTILSVILLLAIDYILLRLIGSIFSRGTTDFSFIFFLSFSYLVIIILGINEYSMKFVILSNRFEKSGLLGKRKIYYKDIKNIKVFKLMKYSKVNLNGDYPIFLENRIANDIIKVYKKNGTDLG